MLRGFKNEELPLAFVFAIFAVIHVDGPFETFSAFSFRHTKVKSLGQEEKTNFINNWYPGCFAMLKFTKFLFCLSKTLSYYL